MKSRSCGPGAGCNPEESFDAVFDFAILHHVPEWRQALGEVRRVLKPGGRFYFDEVLRGFLETRVSRALFDHPEEAHFTAQEFGSACEAVGLVLAQRPQQVGSYFALGVATKPLSG